jgi:hypothetical protein
VATINGIFLSSSLFFPALLLFSQIFEADYADTCGEKISAHVDAGLSGVSRVRRHGSEDPHRRERKL